MPGRVEFAAGTLLGLVLAGPALAAEAMPDGGFLEFLGLLVEDGGEYVDPLDMADISLPEADGQGGDGPAQDWLDDEAARHQGGVAEENDDDDAE